MSLVNKQLWEFWMGDKPMPEDCTYEMMCVMYDAIHGVENKEYAAEQIAWYEGLWRKFKPKYDFAIEHSHDAEKYTEILKLIKEGITMYREELIA